MQRITALTLSLALAGALLSPGAALAAEDPAEAALAEKAAQAEAKLLDRTFYERWNRPGVLDSVEVAERVKADAEHEIDLVDRALGVRRDFCQSKFFVNRCIDEARRASIERKRELRDVITAADEVVRIDRVSRLKARQAERAKDRSAPVNISPREVRENRAEPMQIAPRSVREKADPIEVAPKRVREPSAPVEWHGKEPQEPKAPAPIPGRDAAAEADRAAAEAANEAFYAEKQEKARKRMEDAEKIAAKRRAEREAKQRKFEETLDEREAAQKRYEASQKERKSNLSNYF